MKYEIHHTDCLAFMQTLPDNHVDAIVTDPPYGLSFMGKKWDYDVPSEEIWSECLRVLKPGGHLLAFAGTRTQHRMALRIEDAGFEIRDMIAWVYGSGFPKSHAIDKALDGIIGKQGTGFKTAGDDGRDAEFKQDLSKRSDYGYKYAPATPAARQWHGWGTALKPALEPITVARKPLIGTVADNVLTWGTGGVNVDGCRVEVHDKDVNIRKNGAVRNADFLVYDGGWDMTKRGPTLQQGRWPANLIHDGSEEVTALLDDAARFFYCAKASKRDRDEGCEGMEEREAVGGMKATGLCRKCGRQKVNTSGECQCAEPDFGPIQRRRTNHHPTVKPTDLMRYLCRLVTPPNGIVFDPFMGSGSTGKAAVLEGFDFIGCDMTAEYVDIARARIEHAAKTRPNTLFP